jgi:hypothetical protein
MLASAGLAGLVPGWLAGCCAAILARRRPESQERHELQVQHDACEFLVQLWALGT